MFISHTNQECLPPDLTIIIFSYHIVIVFFILEHELDPKPDTLWWTPDLFVHVIFYCWKYPFSFIHCTIIKQPMPDNM